MKIILELKNLETKTTEELVFSSSPLVLGRSKICDIQVSDQVLSRQHCQLDIGTDGKAKLKDLDSANGTFVGGQKITETALSVGQTFALGNTEVKIVKIDPYYDPDEEPTPIELIYEPSKSVKIKAPAAEVSVSKAKPKPPATPKAATPVPSAPRAESASVEVTLKTPLPLKRSTAKSSFKTKDWVQVSLLWKGELADLKCFDRGQIVTIGEAPSNDFLVAVPSLPEKFQFLKILPNGVEVQIHPSMSGVVETRKTTLSLDELRKGARQTEIGQSTFVQFEDRCLIEVGPFSLFIQSVRLNLTAPISAPFIKEPFFAGVTTLVAAGMILFMFAISGLTPSEPEVKPEEPVVKLAPPEDAVKPPVPTPPPPPPPKQQKLGEVRSRKAQLSGTEGEGARAKGDEGKVGRTTGKVKTRARAIGIVTNSRVPIKTAPKGASGKETDLTKAKSGLRTDQGIGSGKEKPKGTGTQAPSQDIKPQVKVEDTGISGVLSKRDGGGGRASQGGAMEKGGLGGELEGSLEGLERGGDIDSRGSGGRGAKGLGLGGGGSGIEVGGLSTKGKGGGKSGFGLGSSGSKGDAEVSYSAEDVEVRDGLTREEIERVVKAHEQEVQACYEKALISGGNPSLGGRLKVGWFVNSQGRATTVKLEAGPSGGEYLFNCVSQRIQTWQFPKPRGGSGAQVSWPWVFRKGG